MRKLVVLSMMGFAALVSSCNLFKGAEKKEEAPPAEQQATTAPEPTEHAVTPVATENVLANMWQSACTPSDTLGFTNYRSTVHMTEQNTFEKTQNFFTADCDTAAAMTYKVSGNYAMLGANANNASVQNVDFTVNTAIITVTDAKTVETMNSQNFCGIAEWALGKETDITGKSCGGFSVQKGEVVMDVYETKENNVFFGQKFTFGAPNTPIRPEAVSADAYTKG